MTCKLFGLLGPPTYVLSFLPETYPITGQPHTMKSRNLVNKVPRPASRWLETCKVLVTSCRASLPLHFMVGFLFVFIHFYCMQMCMSVHPCLQCLWRPEEGNGVPGTEMQVFVRQPVGTGNWTPSYTKPGSVPDHWAIFPASVGWLCSWM